MRIALAASALLALLSVAPAASALEWLEPARDQVFTGSPVDAARAFVHAQPTLGAVELTTRSVLPTVVGTTVRLEQRWHGLPVLGAAAAVRVTPDGHIRAATSTLVPRLGLTTTAPTLAAADAMALVGSTTQRATSDVGTPVLAVLASDEANEGGSLVWQVDVASKPGGERFLIDATTGQVLRRQALARQVKGRVYQTDFLSTPTPIDVDLLDLDVSTPQRLTGYSGQLSVYEYVSGGENSGYTAKQTIGPNVGDDFLYDPPANKRDETDEFAAINSYYHVHRIREFYTKTLGVDMSDPSWKLGVVANALEEGQYLDNAFFSAMGIKSPATPNLIAIGQGHVDFAYDSDVFMHEFTHYVSDNAIGYNEGQFGVNIYGVDAFSGSIDEGIADYFACTVNGDPVLGEAALGNFARDLSAPSATCPDGLTGETHEDGKLPSTAAWAIRELVGREIGDQLIWGGFSLLQKGTSLQDFATTVLKTADDMVAASKLTTDQRTQIATIFADRGLDDCDHVLSLNKEIRTTAMFGLDTLGQYFGADCKQLQKQNLSLTSSFHFSYKPEAGAKRVRFNVTVNPQQGFGSSDDLDWGIYLRKSKTVSFKTNQGFPEVNKFDTSLTDINDSEATLTIGEGTDTPLDPDVTYYLVLAHQNCPYTGIVVEAVSDLEIPPAAGGAGGAGGTGGAAGTGGASGSSGHSGSAGKSGAAGRPGAAGTAGVAGVGGAPSAQGPATVPSAGEVGGGCQASGTAPSGWGYGALLALGAVGWRRRRVGPTR